MSYPQPDSDAATVANQKFFRFLTTLFTDGDMYMSKSGCHAIALGPESDISKVNVGYFDPTQQGNMGQFTVDSQRAFVSQLTSYNDQSSVYTPSNVPGRILFWPNDLFNVEYRPANFTADARSRLDLITPVLDVIQYFTPVEGLQSARTDKHYHYQQIPFPFSVGAGLYFLVVPFYGRKYASVLFSNRTTQAMNLALKGVTYLYNTQSPATEEVISASAAVASAANRRIIVNASVNGMYDALLLELDYAALPVGNVNLSITVSDNPL